MSILRKCARMVKEAALGDSLIPQEFTIGLPEPQTEISVWLDGIGEPIDVTWRHTTACTSPLTLCVGFDNGPSLTERDLHGAALKFRERGGRGRVLGEIRLRFHSILSCGASRFVLFRVRGSTNYCLARTRLWAHYLLDAYSQRRGNDPPDLKMTLLERRAAIVTFIRPHPLCLVSLGDKENGHIFPMNIMGELGNGYFGLALRDARSAAAAVERAGRIAISSVPFSQCRVLFQLLPNHKRESADWTRVPFETKPSPKFGIPAPAFATRVREMEIEKILKPGSHRFFIARIVSDETLGEGPQACVIHGFYQCWRLRGDPAALQASVIEDAANKRAL